MDNFPPAISNAVRPTNIAISPRLPNNMQSPTEASASGSTLEVKFDIDGSHSTISGISTTPGPLIIYGAVIPGSNAESYDSCDEDLSASDGEE